MAFSVVFEFNRRYIGRTRKSTLSDDHVVHYRSVYSVSSFSDAKCWCEKDEHYFIHPAGTVLGQELDFYYPYRGDWVEIDGTNKIGIILESIVEPDAFGGHMVASVYPSRDGAYVVTPNPELALNGEQVECSWDRFRPIRWIAPYQFPGETVMPKARPGNGAKPEDRWAEI